MPFEREKGFLYFENLGQIDELEIDGTLVFNEFNGPEKVPLKNFNWDENAMKTLVCHDFQGGYMMYESVLGMEFKHVSNENDKGTPIIQPFCFFHWWYIDIFVYFSHKFVTIPPLTWIEQAHQHGVLILGTFITEFDAGYELCSKLFSSKQSVEKLAKIMVDLAVSFSFDGWLINIENKLEVDHIQYVDYFLSCLKIYFNKRFNAHNYPQIIWYDSVLSDGKLEWQNELNNKNCLWFKHVDGFFLNYNWGEENLSRSVEFLKHIEKHHTFDIYVGIDVFGRNCIGSFYIHINNMFDSLANKLFSRLKLPILHLILKKIVRLSQSQRMKIGGWNCAEPLFSIRKNKMSVAIFAPGWVCENFPNKLCLFDNTLNFWKLLSKLIFPHKLREQVFSTNFYIGFHELKSSSVYYNLNKQQLQPFYLSLKLLREAEHFEINIEDEDFLTVFLCEIPINFPSYSIKVLASCKLLLAITMRTSNNESSQVILNPFKQTCVNEQLEQIFTLSSSDVVCVTQISMKPIMSNVIKIFHFLFKPSD